MTDENQTPNDQPELPAEESVETPASVDVDPIVPTYPPVHGTPEATAQSDDGEEEQVDEEAPLLNIEQPKVNMRDDLRLDKPLEDDISLADCLVILRESHRNARAVTAHNDAYISRIEEAEQRLSEQFDKLGKEIGDGDGSLWFRALMESLTTAQVDDFGLKATERPDSNWVQALSYNGKEIRAGQPRQSLSAGQHTVDELLSYMTKRAGVGTTFDFQMPHSGIWLRFRSPSTTEIVTMQHELSQKRVILGAETKGMAFSNAAETLMSVAISFALSFVIEASINFKTPTDLESKLDALDGPFVLLGLASTMFPGGLPYASPCIADPTKCNSVMKARLNMHTLLRMDELSFSKYQLNILSRRFGQQGNRTNDDELAKYRAEHRNGREKIVWFGNIGLRLGTPTLMDQREAGEAWIGSIIEMTQGAFNEPPHGTNRNRYITQLGRTTTARQYAHWVKAVLDRDEDTPEGYRLISEELDVINQFLNKVMSSSDYADDFFTTVKDFIEESTVAMVAIPSYNCPHCGTPQADKFHERFPHLAPLDMLTMFFILASRKLSYKNPTKTLVSQD